MSSAPASKKMVSKEEVGSDLPQDNHLHPLVNAQAAKDIFAVLLVFRFANALCVRTFFQPDEYFQSLEPAWQMAFGNQSGAWITWEWEHQLRSSLHPVLFAIIYYVLDKPMVFLSFFPQFRGLLFSVLPNIVQGIFAATGDYYMYQFSERLYGIGSNNAWAALLITIFSPWQWFCSTRTFSNCLETTITIVAIYFWPWNITSNTVLGTGSDPSYYFSKAGTEPAKISESKVFPTSRSINHLRISLFLAGTACILRPTNALIWFSILMPTLTGFFSATGRATVSDYLIFLQEAVLCGSGVLLLSALSDRLYYGIWTFPPYQLLNFNISQDVAVFYGRNDWHYYLTQGLPLLLTTYLPFTFVALFRASSSPTTSIRFILITTILLTITTLSLISHKEVRFIYPLLPLLHILTAPTIAAFFVASTTTQHTHPKSNTTEKINTYRRLPLLSILLILNILIAGYTSLIHQRGVISSITFLRTEYESLALDGRGRPLSSPDAGIDDYLPKYTTYTEDETFTAFLMPCHSTPWRSQLIHPGLKAWALTCEPPLHLAPHSKEREEYRDEADRFFDNPGKFLREEVNTKERPWPRYIVGFEGIEGVLREWYEGEMKGFKMRERWRGGNSHWHDHWRRKGDVVVWEFVDGSKVHESRPKEEWLRL